MTDSPTGDDVVQPAPEVVPAGAATLDVVDVRTGMFGVQDGGDTSGFGGLVRTVAMLSKMCR